MRKFRFSQLLSLAGFLGLGAGVLSGTEARATCYSPNTSVNQCYVYVSWNSGTQGWNCTTQQGKWCQRVNPTGTFAYTPITYRNWGSYTEVKTAAELWTAAQTSTTAGNSIYLQPSTASVNDIDFENGNFGANGWWGLTTMPGKVASGGCLPRSSINIKMNTYYLSASSTRRMHTALHEFGHGFGLGHTSQSHVMNPNLGISVLTDCDKKGCDSLYP